VVSPDLTRNDPTKLGASGGPITKDNTSVEYYCTIFAFAESPVTRGVLWAGSDDGLIHVSRNDGRTWDNVTPPALKDAWAMISIIEPSPTGSQALLMNLDQAVRESEASAAAAGQTSPAHTSRASLS